MDRFSNLLELSKSNRLIRPNHLRKSCVPLALDIPILLLGPSIDNRKEFQKEYAKVVCLFFRAAMDAGYHTLEDLTQGVQDVEVGDSVLMQCSQEVNRKKSIRS